MSAAGTPTRADAAPATGPRLHLILPGPLSELTGGTIYDRRMVAGLREIGWRVDVHELEGRFPDPGPRARESLDAALSSIGTSPEERKTTSPLDPTALPPDPRASSPDPAGGTTPGTGAGAARRPRVIIDGLAMGALPEVVRAHSDRLRILALVHHPLADETGLAPEERKRFEELETAALAACAGVLVTSRFTAGRVRQLGVLGSRVRVAIPGTDRAAPATGPGPEAPPALLCVAGITPRKGQDVLVRALAALRDTRWTCTCAGSLERDPDYAAGVLDRVRDEGLEDRIDFVGECDEAELDDLYRSSSIFVLPSHYEGYGMALTEALARGLPVVSTTGGAIPGTVPGQAGILVPPGDATALATALEGLLANDDGAAERRARLARAARRHARRLPDWERAARAFADAALELAPGGAPLPGAGERAAAGGTFAADWLDLREPVDHRSRPEALLPPLRSAWRAGGWSRVLDLGSGTGSNLRYLAPRLAGPQEWTLLDRDPDLLDRADPPGPDCRVSRVRGDLAREGLARVPSADLVTASALLDLVSETWLRGLVDACRSAGCAALLALTYDGSIRWGPREEEDPVDASIRRAFNAHQRRDKGLGPALGPAAATRAEKLFREAGYRTWLHPSPWRLEGGPESREAELARRLVDGWKEAATRAAAEGTLAEGLAPTGMEGEGEPWRKRPPPVSLVAAWAARRQDSIAAGEFSLTVGHQDLLALPPAATGSGAGPSGDPR